jgi:hypothetical protein
VAAGFEQLEIIDKGDIFEGAMRPSAAVAAFGTHGLTFRAVKPDA